MSGTDGMLPIAPLMIEHRLIERMIFILKDEVERIKKDGKVDPVLIDTAVDFIRFYADRTHHGKEEDILFRALRSKKMSKEHKQVMDDLVQEHVYGRKMTKELVVAKEWYLKGDKESIKVIVETIQALTEFYPKHIAKEDQEFFIPVMKYLSTKEKDDMLKEFREFDRKLIHEKYDKLVEGFEKSKGLPGRTMKADWYKYI
jgi:hemerythrin-like domain-containing protein